MSEKPLQRISAMKGWNRINTITALLRSIRQHKSLEFFAFCLAKQACDPSDHRGLLIEFAGQAASQR